MLLIRFGLFLGAILVRPSLRVRLVLALIGFLLMVPAIVLVNTPHPHLCLAFYLSALGVCVYAGLAPSPTAHKRT